MFMMTEKMYNKLKSRIDALRKSNERKRELRLELAKALNTSQPQIFRIENSKHSPQLNTLLKILNVYGYTIEFKKIK